MRRSFIVLLTLITAGIHIYFFATGDKSYALYDMFLLNALGYLGLISLLLMPLGLPASLHRLVRPVFIGYAMLTIVLYLIIAGTSGIWSIPLAPIAKFDELILIWQLFALGNIAVPRMATSRKSDAML
jgi:hypothetical protein